MGGFAAPPSFFPSQPARRAYSRTHARGWKWKEEEEQLNFSAAEREEEENFAAHIL